MKIIILLCVLTISSVCFSQNLKMNLVIQKCIDSPSGDTVTIIIENSTNSDIWIKTNHLTFYFIVHSIKGNTIPRKTSRQLNPIGSGYLKIDKESVKKLDWRTDFFDNYNFELNEDYFIECVYKPPHLTRKGKKEIKKSNIILYKNKFSGKSNLFQICYK